MDLNQFMSDYIDFNIAQNKKKHKEIESFRDIEIFVKNYEEAVSDFEKAKHNSQLDYFFQIKSRLFNFLIDFDPRNLQVNIDKVQSATAFLEEKEIEFKEVSNNLKFIVTTWNSFSERRSLDLKRDVKFFEEIRQRISSLEDSFSIAGLEEIGRIEEAAEALKTEITKLISIFDALFIIINKNVFIGDDAMELKEEIEFFLQDQIYTLSIHELYEEIKDLETKIDIGKKTAIWKKKGIPVVKIENKDDNMIYDYSLMFNNSYILEENNIPREHSNFYKTEKYLYFDNYPESGIFSIDSIKENFSISDDHLEAINEFNIKSSNYFLTFSLLSLSAIGLSLFNVLNVWISSSLAILFMLLFTQKFNSLSRQMEKKHKVKNMFFFLPTNYYISKIGDVGLKYQLIVPNILYNFDKIHPQDIKEYKKFQKEVLNG